MNKRILWVGIFVLSAAAIAEAANDRSKRISSDSTASRQEAKVQRGKQGSGGEQEEKGMESEPLFSNVVESAAIENDLPASLLYGLFWHESRFREDAKRDERHLCRKHAWKAPECRSYGLGQVILGYHRGTCAIETAGDLQDYRKAVPCAARILGGYLRAEKGNIPKALKRFNGPLGKDYAKKVMAEAKRFGFQS